MDMNKTLTTTGIYREGTPPELFPDYDARLNRMQKLAFEVGSVVMQQPQGTVAKLSNGELIGVTEYHGKLETVLLHEYQTSLPDADVMWFCITKQAHQDPDWGDEDELDQMSEILTAWLAKPAFTTVADPDQLLRLAQNLEKWVADYRARSKND